MKHKDLSNKKRHVYQSWSNTALIKSDFQIQSAGTNLLQHITVKKAAYVKDI